MDLISKKTRDEKQIGAVEGCAITNFLPIVPTHDQRNYRPETGARWIPRPPYKADRYKVHASFFSSDYPKGDRSIDDQPKEDTNLQRCLDAPDNFSKDLYC